jgi:hypothetical protein
MGPHKNGVCGAAKAAEKDTLRGMRRWRHYGYLFGVRQRLLVPNLFPQRDNATMFRRAAGATHRATPVI